MEKSKINLIRKGDHCRVVLRTERTKNLVKFLYLFNAYSAKKTKLTIYSSFEKPFRATKNRNLFGMFYSNSIRIRMFSKPL